MTRGSLTLYGARIATAAALAVTIPALAACGDDDEAPDPSLIAEVEQALCDSFGPAGSMVLDGQVYDLSDCP